MADAGQRGRTLLADHTLRSTLDVGVAGVVPDTPAGGRTSLLGTLGIPPTGRGVTGLYHLNRSLRYKKDSLPDSLISHLSYLAPGSWRKDPPRSPAYRHSKGRGSSRYSWRSVHRAPDRGRHRPGSCRPCQWDSQSCRHTPADSWEESRTCLAGRSSHTWIPGPLEGWSMSRRGWADTGHQPPPAAVLKQSSGRHSFFKISMRMRTDFGDLGWTKTNKNGN